VLCKVLCHNLCVLIQAIHELGIEPKFYREKSVRNARDMPVENYTKSTFAFGS
jgi:hypothetical protein